MNFDLPQFEHETEQSLSPEEVERLRFEKHLAETSDVVYGKLHSRFFRVTEGAQKESERYGGDAEGARKDTIRAMIKLAWELRGSLSEYQTLLSDDASGRLPTLFLRHVVGAKRKEQGKESPQTFFIALGQGGERGKGAAKNVDAFFAEKKAGLGKTLVVTEHIAYGGTMRDFANLLSKHQKDFDIAAVSTLEDTPRFLPNKFL